MRTNTASPETQKEEFQYLALKGTDFILTAEYNHDATIMHKNDKVILTFNSEAFERLFTEAVILRKKALREIALSKMYRNAHD